MLFWELTKINSCTNFRASPMFPVLHNGGFSTNQQNASVGNMYPLVARGRLLSIVFK